MNKNNTCIKETTILLVGEIAVSALVVLGYLVAKLSFFGDVQLWKAVTGTLLGTVVTVGNFFFLSLSVNRAVDRYIELRGSREMTEEETAQFTAAHSAEIQNTIKTSFIIRTVTMLAALVLAFVSGWFEPLATAIPLLAFRPILTLGETLRRRMDKTPDPDKFIRYDEEEKESDATEA